MSTAPTAAASPVALALDILREWESHVADWEEQCALEARDGFSPSHCVHGSCLWVDHDVACGMCEGGSEPNEYTPRADLLVWALDVARGRIELARRARVRARRAAHTRILVILGRLRATPGMSVEGRELSAELIAEARATY